MLRDEEQVVQERQLTRVNKKTASEKSPTVDQS